MSKYVFITPTIGEMGGAQMYIRNKLIYLRNKGWDVVIITATRSDNVIISDLIEYKKNCFPELRYNCYEFCKRKVNKVCNKIIKLIGDVDNEVIIESTCLEEATWAEYISKCIGAKHLFYTLQESNEVSNFNFFRFLDFKYERRELAGIAPTSLSNMFEPYKIIDENRSYYLIAACSNVEEDVPHSLIDTIKRKKFDRLVGCLSRLEKPFVEQGILGVVDYCKNHPSYRVGLVLLGGTYKSQIRKLKKITSTVKNLELIITGYIYPVPTKMLELCDVMFSSAGSAWVCERSGVPTISFDCNDLKPIGILGRTTNNCMFRGIDELALKFKDLLEDVLTKKSYIKTESHYNATIIDFTPHMSFLKQSEQKKEYFDVLSIRKITKKEHIRSLLLNIFGADFYSFIGGLRTPNAVG